MITDNYKPVRVAILDTGIDISNPYIQKNWTSKKLYRDFLEDDDVASTLKADDKGYSSHYVQEVVKLIAADRRDQATDLAGHGTHLAGIVLQLTPDASLCVARVLKHNLNPYDTAKAFRRVALVSSPSSNFMNDSNITSPGNSLHC
jgi:subtilisin family serine protease